MQNDLILYRSRTGFTARYATWLGKALDAPCVPWKDYQIGMERNYARIICGGGIYGSELDGFRQFRRLEKRAKGQSFIYFATGLRPATEHTTSLLLRYNFGREPWPKFYYFQGGLNLEGLDKKERALLTALRAMLGRKRDLSESDLQLFSLLQSSVDYCDHDRIFPFVESLTS